MNTERAVSVLTQAMVEQARYNATVQTVLAEGIVHANDTLASLHGQLIGALTAISKAAA